MSFLSFGLNEKITLWRATGRDGFNKITFDSPEIVMCRWEDRTELVQMEDGSEVRAGAAIYLGVDVEVEDFFYRGVSYDTDPKAVNKAYRVLDFKKTPGLWNEDFERVAYLRRAYF